MQRGRIHVLHYVMYCHKGGSSDADLQMRQMWTRNGGSDIFHKALNHIKLGKNYLKLGNNELNSTREMLFNINTNQNLLILACSYEDFF